MANSYNQKPIRINEPMPLTFWDSLRQLGVLASTQGKSIEVISIRWIDPGPSSTVVIFDGVGVQPNNLLFQDDTPLDFVGQDIQYAYPPGVKKWRNWQVMSMTGGELEIDYR
jgi:hypothetical protein